MNEERDMMIDRYLDGSMTPLERLEFLRSMDSNPELRQSLAAEQLIRDAVRRDHTEHARPPVGSRDRFLTMLAGVSAELNNGPTPEAPPTAQHMGAQGGSATSSVLKSLPWVGGGLAMILSAVLILPTVFGPSEAPMNTPPATAPAVVKQARTAPLPEAVPQSVPSPAQKTGEAPADQATKGAAKDTRLTPVPNARQTQPVVAAKKTSPERDAQRRRTERNGRVTSDSARGQVTIQLPKIMK